MIKNYILIGWRSLSKNPLFSFINIFGLALSMSVCMMVLLRIVDNFHYDSFHPAPEKTYRILSGIAMQNGNKVDLATTPVPLREMLAQDTSIIQEVVGVYPSLTDDASDGTKELPVYGAFTQPAFFNVFGFVLKHGDAETALSQPNSIVLSEATARKFFAGVNPVGKMLSFRTFGSFLVTGVIMDPLAKSHIRYDAFASASTMIQLEKEGRLPQKLEVWDTFEDAYTYVLLKENIHESVLAGKLGHVANTLNSESQNVMISLTAQPIGSITPGWKELHHETSRGSSWGKLIAEISIAMIILVSACFNYTNLSIARALTRGKEVGIRKISGAARWQIFAQYITESLMVSFFALCVAQVFLAFILEYKPFNSGYEMVPDVRLSLGVFAVFLGFSVFAGIMAGAMPAWILSAFKPVRVLRSMWSEKILGNLSLRKTLMVFQFALSLVILIFLSAFYRQFEFMGSADGGFHRKNIIVIPFHGKPEVLDPELNRVSGVELVAHTSGHFGKSLSANMALYEDKSLERYHQFNYYHADAELISMMGLKIAAGKSFSGGVHDQHAIIVNEKAAKAMGYTNPEDAVGRVYYSEDSTQLRITGVIRDFYHRSVGHTIVPLVFRNSPAGFREVLLKVDDAAGSDVVARIESAFRKVYADEEFTASWLDKNITDMHHPTGDISLLGFLAFMTVAIATMGLLGLVVYTVETRRKEISIRKIVGASVSQIVVLLSKGYTKLLVISGMIALPIGYVLSSFFLRAFANRISFGLEYLLASFLLLLVIGLGTIGSQTFRAARENPSQNLRSE